MNILVHLFKKGRHFFIDPGLWVFFTSLFRLITLDKIFSVERAPVFPIFYLPPVAWFVAAAREKKVYLEIWQAYRKQRYTTRAVIKTANGPQNLVLPVGRTGKHTRIWEKKLSKRENWQVQHWRSIVFAYRNSPYFEYYADTFQVIYQKEHENLVGLLLELIQTVSRLLQLDANFVPTTKLIATEHYTQDLRMSFDTKEEQKPLWFQPLPYTQVFGEFIPNLSILDLLFNEGPYSKKILMGSFLDP